MPLEHGGTVRRSPKWWPSLPKHPRAGASTPTKAGSASPLGSLSSLEKHPERHCWPDGSVGCPLTSATHPGYQVSESTKRPGASKVASISTRSEA